MPITDSADGSFCLLNTSLCSRCGWSTENLVRDGAVYSLGLFVDPEAAKKSLESYSNKPVAQLVNDQDFYDGEAPVATLTELSVRVGFCRSPRQ